MFLNQSGAVQGSLDDVPPLLAARVVRRGIGLVREHLALIRENFPDKDVYQGAFETI